MFTLNNDGFLPLYPLPFWGEGRVRGSDVMSLTSGTKLGPYEILAPIGAGGMEESLGLNFSDAYNALAFAVRSLR
jgi:hypothetical protein